MNNCKNQQRRCCSLFECLGCALTSIICCTIGGCRCGCNGCGECRKGSQEGSASATQTREQGCGKCCK